MIITMSGSPGSGKSTVAPVLQELLKYAQSRKFEIMDVGKLRRKAAKERGMTLEEFNQWSSDNPEIGDKSFDDFVRKEAQRVRDAIVVGRVAFNVLPQSIKLFIDVDPKVGAERIFEEKKGSTARNEKEAATVEEQMELNKKRVDQDIERYKKLYNIDISDESNYDLIVDTTGKTVDEICEEILAGL